MTAYILHDRVLSSNFCNQLVDTYKDSVQPGVVLDGDKNGRQSKVSFINDGTNRDDIIARIRHSARWLYDSDRSVSEHAEVQFSRYDVGDSYAPHVDYRFDWGHDRVRKYTVVINLSPPDAYEGGLLVFPSTEEVVPKRQGAAAIFPGFVAHGVTPVLEGTRYSLALWLWGKQWK